MLSRLHHRIDTMFKNLAHYACASALFPGEARGKCGLAAGGLLFFSLLLGLSGCGGPAWYAARDVGVAGHVLVGYGEGESVASARADAAREIAETLGVSVHSTGEMVSTRDGEESGVFSQFRVALTSRVILNDLSTMKLAKASGRYYVALSYDNRTLFQKLGFMPGRSTNVMPLQTTGFKATLPFSHKLSRLGISPSDFWVVRRHGGWSLVVGQATYPIPFETWFRLLFVEKTENQGLRLSVTPQGPLASGSRYQVHITPPQDFGYLSLYHVSESGQTLALTTNRPVDSLKPITFPDEHLYSGLEAIAPEAPGSRDMLLAAWTREPMQPRQSYFPASTIPLVDTDERAFSYGDLLEHVKDSLWVSQYVWIARSPDR
jgi:hypothetical protein